jgi:hypothetical protein
VVRDETQLPELSSVWRLPPDLDPEWMAFEVYTEAEGILVFHLIPDNEGAKY